MSGIVMVLGISLIVKAMGKLDAHLGGALRGVPFCVEPGREFWSRHEKCTWSEVLKMDPGEFDEDWSALGSKKQKEAAGIYQVNNDGYHPKYPYGGDENHNGIKWYTYGERLPAESTVQDWHHPSEKNAGTRGSRLGLMSARAPPR